MDVGDDQWTVDTVFLLQFLLLRCRRQALYLDVLQSTCFTQSFAAISPRDSTRDTDACSNNPTSERLP